MAFDTNTRNKLAKMVADARDLLKNEFTQQLQELYGIQPDGKITALEKLAHLDDEQLDIARVLRERVAHISGGLGAEKKPVKAAVDRMTREQSFTVLNRFSALRMCEERGLLQQCVGDGLQSKGFQVYLKTAGSGLGGQYDRFRTFIFSIFDEIAIDLGILFDRFSPFGFLFPREAALGELLEVINREELKHIWAEDEAIGWIYQYFNSPEERKAMRKASAAPRNSRELAVRNQFFTPRYVVEFLTDNTLGRIWYEMRQGNTALKDNCRYLGRRPNEVFLETGQEPPEEDEALNENLSQEELLNKTTYIPFRAQKDPRDLKILDPACGSGHFLLYAVDLLETIYEEAWQDVDSPLSDATGHTLREDFESFDELRKAIPELILRWNLYGIDIDPRAVQITPLALWLRAQRLWQTKGVRSVERPRLTKLNIVCAEPMPGDENMLKEFTDGLKPKVLGQLVEVIFQKMRLAGEAGSLLKIEEEIKDSIVEARKQWEAKPKPEQAGLFPEMDRPRPKQKEIQFDVSEINDVKFWDRAEALILQSLQEYAERVENGLGDRRRMFAEDAAQGFAFIDLCRKRFDVVSMNPPFGELSINSAVYIKANYPVSSKNIGSTFVERMLNLTHYSGIVGTIIDHATSVRSSYKKMRRKLLYSDGQLMTFCHSGWDVLDANVETCFYTITKDKRYKKRVYCWDISESKDKNLTLISRINNPILASIDAFTSFPNSVPNFSIPLTVLRIFLKYQSLDPYFAHVRTGLSTGNNRRFYKLSWEPPISSDGWCFLSNGGEFSPFYRPNQEVIDWRKVGRPITEYKDRKGKLISRPQNLSFAKKTGLSYGKRGAFLSVHTHPKGRFFTNEGQGIFPNNNHDRYSLLCLINSKLLRVLINEYCGQHKENGYVSLLPINLGSSNVFERFEKYASEIIYLIRDFTRFRLEHSETVLPCYNKFKSLREYIRREINLVKERKEILSKLEEEYNNEVQKLFQVDREGIEWLNSRSDAMPQLGAVLDFFECSEANIVSEFKDYLIGLIFGRWDIRFATGEKNSPKLLDPFDSLPLWPPGMLQNKDNLPAEPDDLVANYPLSVNWSGILVNDKDHPDDIITRVHQAIKIIWKEKADDIELEACEIIGVPSMHDYFYNPNKFFADHLKRYSKNRRKAPIYWPLSTESGSYTLWLYYHRITDQTLYTCVNDFLNPKIETIVKDIERLQNELSETGNAKKRAELEKMQDFRQELIDFREELLRVSKLPYKPNLNDGVLITASPLWKLFRLKKWQNDLKDCWEKLETGEYDWSHLAYSIWPDRVREKCKTNRSIAIAHDLEHLCEIEPKKTKV